MKFTQAVVVQSPAFLHLTNSLRMSQRYKFKFIGGTQDSKMKTRRRLLISRERMGKIIVQFRFFIYQHPVSDSKKIKVSHPHVAFILYN